MANLKESRYAQLFKAFYLNTARQYDRITVVQKLYPWGTKAQEGVIMPRKKKYDKVGRPKKFGRAASEQIIVRVTPMEKILLQERAKEDGGTVSTYVREKLNLIPITSAGSPNTQGSYKHEP